MWAPYSIKEFVSDLYIYVPGKRYVRLNKLLGILRTGARMNRINSVACAFERPPLVTI